MKNWLDQFDPAYYLSPIFKSMHSKQFRLLDKWFHYLYWYVNSQISSYTKRPKLISLNLPFFFLFKGVLNLLLFLLITWRYIHAAALESRPRVVSSCKHECAVVFWKVNIAGATQTRPTARIHCQHVNMKPLWGLSFYIHTKHRHGFCENSQESSL